MNSGPLEGQLFYIFLIAIVDAALLSWVALRWYRRAVSRTMRSGGTLPSAPTATATPVPQPLSASKPPTRLTVGIVRPDDAAAAEEADRTRPAAWRPILIGYCVGAALFSAVITAAMAVEAPIRAPTALFSMWWTNAWPVVPTLIALLLLDRRGGLRLAAAYLVCGSVGVAVLTLVTQAWRGSVDAAPLTNIFWLNAGILFIASLPVALLLVTGWRRIRGVMPLALAATILFGFTLMLFKEVIIRAFNVPALRDLVLGLAVVTSSEVAFYSLYMLMALPVGWLAWRALQALAAGFERKRFSDVQLVVDCWWVIVTAETITTHLAAPFGFMGIGIGVAAFAAYRVGTLATLRLLRVESSGPAQRLLLLRVFGHQARTESLFDRIADRWRFRGPVQLIAGADLAMRTADPADMLKFMGGRLRDMYVASSSELPERLQRLDTRRDPDGRFRVNEFYCFDATWQETLQRLLTLSDAVVMDLRGFTEKNSGCVFELEHLLSRLPTDAIVLVYDTTTDLVLLADLLGKAWARAELDGVARDTGPLSLVRIEGNAPSELDRLMQRLAGRERPRHVVALPELAALAV